MSSNMNHWYAQKMQQNLERELSRKADQQRLLAEMQRDYAPPKRNLLRKLRAAMNETD